jgi:cell division protein FtsQ
MARDTRKIKPPKWKLWLSMIALAVLCVSTGMAGLMVREYGMTDPQFTLSRDHPGALAVEGLQYTAKSKVQRVFAADFERSIFAVPLAERRRRLLAIDWVENASVSRIWPGSIMVRIKERKPIAFVFVRGTVLLIDSFGVLLDQPPQSRFTFPVLSGIQVDDPESRRRARVRSFLEVQTEMGHLAKDLSEVNVADPDNIRIVVKIENRAIELILGDSNFARRYSNFLHHYPEIKKRSPGAATFDLRLDDRITAAGKE